MNYPTPEQILAEEVKYPKEVIQMVISWKREYFIKKWSIATDLQKFAALEKLVMVLASYYDKPVTAVKIGWVDIYNPESNTIHLTKPSIITALHELGHHLYGVSELEACKFSVWLFKKTFSKHYEKLVWKGHLLVKPEVAPDPEEDNTSNNS